MILMFEAVERRRIKQHNDRAWLAYNTAAFHRASKLRPRDLQKITLKPGRRVRQSLDEQRHVIRQIAATYGANPYTVGKQHG